MRRQASEQAASEAKQDYEKELTQLRAQYEERQCLLLSELRKKQRQSGDAVTCSPQDVAASNKLQVCLRVCVTSSCLKRRKWPLMLLDVELHDIIAV